MELENMQIAIRAEGQELTISPMGLLNMWLPGAHPMQEYPGVYEGLHPTDPSKKVYVQLPVLAAALFEAQQKGLNPVLEQWLIPSNSPTKRATVKQHYKAGIERARKVPGFLGLDFGCTVLRGKGDEKQVVRVIGYGIEPGDKLYGAWAQLHLQGRAEPLEHVTTLEISRTNSKMWDQQPAFMVCKSCIDHLLTRKYPMVVSQDSGDAEAIEVPTESYAWQPGRGQQPQGKPAAKPEVKEAQLTPGEPYEGKIVQLRLPAAEQAGVVELEVLGAPFLVWFRKTPPDFELYPPPDLVGLTIAFTYKDRTTPDKRTWHMLEQAKVLTATTDTPPEDMPAENPEMEGDGRE